MTLRSSLEYLCGDIDTEEFLARQQKKKETKMETEQRIISTTVFTPFEGVQVSMAEIRDMTQVEFDNLVLKMATEDGNCVPINPVLAEVPERRDGVKECYYGVSCTRDAYSDTVLPVFFPTMFPAEEIARIINDHIKDMVEASRGGYFYSNRGAFSSASIFTMVREVLTAEDSAFNDKVDEIKKENEKRSSAYEADMATLKEYRQKLQACFDTYGSVISALGRLRANFDATNAVVQDAEKTYKLLCANKSSDLFTLGQTIEHMYKVNEDDKTAWLDCLKDFAIPLLNKTAVLDCE